MLSFCRMLSFNDKKELDLLKSSLIDNKAQNGYVKPISFENEKAAWEFIDTKV